MSRLRLAWHPAIETLQRPNGFMPTVAQHPDMSQNARKTFVANHECEQDMSRRISSFSDLNDAFACYDAGTITIETFDDVLEYILRDHLYDLETLAQAPRPVALFYAARTLEFDVGNGGFAQAAYNLPDWFDLAAEGYRALNLAKAADLIERAAALVNSERASFTANQIDKLFGQFKESRLKKLDDELDDCGFWAMEERIAYALAHREDFLKPDFKKIQTS